jgi:hypothetical protein
MALDEDKDLNDFEKDFGPKKIEVQVPDVKPEAA